MPYDVAVRNFVKCVHSLRSEFRVFPMPSEGDVSAKLTDTYLHLDIDFICRPLLLEKANISRARNKL